MYQTCSFSLRFIETDLDFPHSRFFMSPLSLISPDHGKPGPRAASFLKNPLDSGDCWLRAPLGLSRWSCKHHPCVLAQVLGQSDRAFIRPFLKGRRPDKPKSHSSTHFWPHLLPRLRPRLIFSAAFEPTRDPSSFLPTDSFS